MHHDFNDAILDEVEHRPYPLPEGSWIMTQSWHDLLFAHWPVDRAAIGSTLPRGLEPDVFGEQAWLGIIPFRMTNVAPRGVPALPWISAFPELNVRTYVRVGNRAGIHFLSLDAGNPLAVVVARTLFRLPYHSASMDVRERNGEIEYVSRRSLADSGLAELRATYRPTGSVFRARPGTLEHFLTERYRLFTTDSSGEIFTLDIHHPPWPLQHAEAHFHTNTMAEAAGIRLPSCAPLLHFARRQDMVAWPLRRVAG